MNCIPSTTYVHNCSAPCPYGRRCVHRAYNSNSDYSREVGIGVPASPVDDISSSLGNVIAFFGVVGLNLGHLGQLGRPGEARGVGPSSSVGPSSGVGPGGGIRPGGSCVGRDPRRSRDWQVGLLLGSGHGHQQATLVEQH